MVQLTDKPIDTAALIDGARHPEAGAVVLFLGTTRELTAGRQTVALDYEAYREMAERQLAELNSGMTITALRFATACGMSERLRLDLVLNDFVAAALGNGAAAAACAGGSPGSR